MCVFYQKFRQQRRFFNKIPTIRSNFCQKSDKSDGHFQKWGGATPPHTPPLVTSLVSRVSTFLTNFREGCPSLNFLCHFQGRIFKSCPLLSWPILWTDFHVLVSNFQLILGKDSSSHTTLSIHTSMIFTVLAKSTQNRYYWPLKESRL